MFTLRSNRLERIRKSCTGSLESACRACVLSLGCAVVLSGVPTSGQAPTNPQGADSSTRLSLSQPGEAGETSATISPGDMVDVEVFNTPELSAKQLRVNQDGTLAMPVVGSIPVAGLTPTQANATIESRLRDEHIMYSPSVSLLVTSYSTQGVDVLGEVRNPGIYKFLGTHSLYDAIAAAGGATTSQGSTITITHHDDPTHPLFIHVDSPNYSELQKLTEVHPGDVVDVSRADSIYVLGDVGHPGQYPISYGEPLTALNALALAQGPNKAAKLSKASIVRKMPTGIQTLPVDLQQVEKNKVADPVLQAGDVLVVPHNGTKAFLEIAVPGATAALIGAVAYSLLR